MKLSEKVKKARVDSGLTQAELADKVGITVRSIYDYEHKDVLPKKYTLYKLARELGVSVAYLLDDEETDNQKIAGQEEFLETVKSKYGYKGAKEAAVLLSRTSALFAGGRLDEEEKDLFFESIMEMYLASKAEAREKFSAKRLKKSDSSGDTP